jgi:very-short-patch-repair endonuclease
MVEDNRRQNLLVNAGYRLLRFTAADIHKRADVVVAQVRAALEGVRSSPRVLHRTRRAAVRAPLPDPLP